MPPSSAAPNPPFPGTPTRTAATQALVPPDGSTWLHPVIARPVFVTIGNRTRSGGRSDAHPLPPRQVPGSLAGAGTSIVFVLASSVRVPLAELAISNGLIPGLAGVVKTLAGELGPARIPINGLLPVRIATDRVRELDALRGDPDEVRARLSEHIPLRGYGEPEEFGRAAAFLDRKSVV